MRFLSTKSVYKVNCSISSGTLSHTSNLTTTMFRVILCCALVIASLTDAARILGVFMTPSHSHQIVYQPIWKELSLRGHEVTVITPNPLNDPSLTNLTEIDMSFCYNTWKDHKIATLGAQEHSVTEELKALTSAYMDVAEMQLIQPKVKELINDKTQKFDLVLVEFLFPVMYAFKDLYNCPMVGLTSLQLTAAAHDAIGNPNIPSITPDFVLPFSTKLSFKERVISTLFTIMFRYGTRITTHPKVNAMIAKHFGPNIRPVYDIMREVSLVIGNSNLAIENARPTNPSFIDISGIHLKPKKPLPADLQELLDDAKEGVIYFSLGSNVKSKLLPKERIQVLLKTFEQLPYKILWKFEDEHLPNKSSNVEIRSWLPQQDLLGHPNVKLFITQGGLQSLDEAIYNEVPILAIPFFGDQRFNAHHLSDRGAGLAMNFHTMTSDELKENIHEVIGNPSYKKAVSKLAKISTDQPIPALEKAVWWIEYVLRHNGAEHLRFSGMNIPFYQYYLLDVIAFLVAAVSVVLFVLLRIFKHVVLCYRIVARALRSMSAYQAREKSHVE